MRVRIGVRRVRGSGVRIRVGGMRVRIGEMRVGRTGVGVLGKGVPEMPFGLSSGVHCRKVTRPQVSRGICHVRT